MQIKTMTKDEARDLFEYYVSLGTIPESVFEKLNSDYRKVRNRLLDFEEEADKENTAYKKDLCFACLIYEYFQKEDFFNDTVANNLGFWIYLCMQVAPDIVFRRHGLVDSYFFNKNGRIYLQALWLYIHMSFQTDIETTKTMLEKLSTDYILQMAERTGRDGFYVDVYREIVRVIVSLPSSVANAKVNGANLFRRVMIQNTAKTNVYNLVAENKITEYVQSLFRSCKVEVKDYE